MINFRIKRESPCIRCEICHKSDYYDKKTNTCMRCSNISISEGIKISKKKWLNKKIWILLSFLIAIVFLSITLKYKNDPHLLKTISLNYSTRSVPLNPNVQQEASFSLNKMLIASIGGNQRNLVKILPINTNSPMCFVEDSTNWIDSLAFSPGGDILVTASSNSISFWRVSDNKLLRVIKGDNDQVFGLAFSPDGLTLATGNKYIRLWRVSDGELLWDIKFDSWITSLTFSPDGQTLISGSADGKLRLWNTNNGSFLKSFDGHSQGVLTTAFSPDGQTLISGGWDLKIKLWNVNNGGLIRTLDEEPSLWHSIFGFESTIYSIAVSPDGQMIASGGANNNISIWKSIDGSLLETLKGHNDNVIKVTFTEDGKQLISASKDGTVRLWHIK